MDIKLRNSTLNPIFATITPYIQYESHGFFSFQSHHFNSDTLPIFHHLQLMINRDEIDKKLLLEDELNRWDLKNGVDEDQRKRMIAKLDISEFRSEWKDKIGGSWFDWLDSVDGEHSIIGLRADEIERQNRYPHSLDQGSLFYIQNLVVHPAFRGNKLGAHLLKHSFQNLFSNQHGIVFLIAQPNVDNKLCFLPAEQLTQKLIDYYKDIGFVETEQSDISKHNIMEMKL